MKKLHFLLSFFLLLFVAGTLPSCAPKSGCPGTEELAPKKTRKGGFKKGKTKSGLFPKKMSKRM